MNRALSTSIALVLAAAVAAAAAGPGEAVNAFYRSHFARRDLMPLSREGVERARPFLTERLHGLLARELERAAEAAAAHAGPEAFAPFVAGDVFTGTERPPDAFRRGRVTVSGTTARVEVASVWTAPPETRDAARAVTVVLRRVGGRWLVDDVVYPDGGSLVDLLSRPEYDSYGT